ncbi:hypothetical protein FSARC_347 [Fusarium sarcochroum]|uniref:Heterokaryon incompatibility protein n=1 Tax=Fusarium sarcochroum TaxID=1208366 RepID=A0A8H4XGL7_9HYPO|nr:hypothetical protein FSARC_347 [Fusarium sarcochroum]
MTFEKQRIVIAGGGLGGLAAACRLAGDGHDVELYERSTSLSTASGAIFIRAGAVKCFYRWQLREAFEAITAPIELYETRGAGTNEPIHRLDASVFSKYPEWSTDRQALQTVLYNEAVKAGAKVHFGTEIANVEEDNHHAFVTLKDGSKITADILLAADGISSRLRSQILSHVDPARLAVIRSPSTHYPTEIPIAKLANNEATKAICIPPDSEKSIMWPGQGGYLIGKFNRHRDLFNAMFSIQHGPADSESSEQKLYDATSDTNVVRNFFASYNPTVTALASMMESCSRWRLARLEPLDTWSSPGKRLVLLGDAAHAMLPNLAAGFSCIVEDIEALSKILRDSGKDTADVIEMWENIRIPRVSKLQNGSLFHYNLYNAGKPLDYGLSEEEKNLPMGNGDRDAPLNSERFMKWAFDHDTTNEARNKDHCDDTPLSTSTKQVRKLEEAASSPMTYQQLDLGCHQIRVLHLLPGDPTDPLRCVLQTAILDNDPEYEALSYAWGDPLEHRSIEVDGRQRGVTVNLYHALLRLRYSKSERCLWVDALCIDQDNDFEKSHQVNLMKNIYSRTNRAILWLGDFSDEPNAIANHIPCHIATAAFNLLESLAANHHIEGFSEDVDESISGLHRLLQLSWWHRAWTVQEAILPPDATFVCGTVQLLFSQFVQACANLFEHIYRGCCYRDNVLQSALSELSGLTQAQQRIQDNSLTIHYALNVFRVRHASDPRDKVYAYLGLASNVSANYALPHEEVFKLTTRSLIEESGRLGCLLRTAEEERSPTLPTWAPDWCASFDDKRYSHEINWFYLYPFYDAADSTKAKTRASSSEVVLDLQGLVLDSIVRVGDILDTPRSMKEMVTEWQDKVFGEYPLGGTYREASCRTILADIYYGQTSYIRIDSCDNAEEILYDELDNFWTRIALSAFDKRGFSTAAGMIGLGNRDIQVGDSICILAGGKMPFILRQVEGPGGGVAYQYIGQAYVHGIMDGEMMDEGRDLEWISLV